MFAALSELKLSPVLGADGHTIYFGNNETLDCQTGQARLAFNRTASEIKRAYSAAAVKQTAKKYGWVPQTSNTSTEFVFNKR